MTDKEYLELAEKVGLTDAALGLGMTDNGDATQNIIDLCKQVAAHAKAEEREECAQECDELHYQWKWDDSPDSDSGPRDCAKAIRARALKD